MEKPRVRVYLDGDARPIADQELPTEVSLDTTDLADGPHRLTILAQGESGREGIEEIPFVVHNGPGIIISGLRPHSIRRGKVRFTIDAFSADDPFDPRRAEARSSNSRVGLGDVFVRYCLGGLVRRAHVGRPG